VSATQLVPGGQAEEFTKIVFGTDGWRAKIADEYNFVNVGAVPRPWPSG